jgi:hypothetical protein
VLIEKIDKIGAAFGGYSQLSKYLSSEDLLRLATLNCPLWIGAPGDLLDFDGGDSIDLTTFGYISGSQYSVSDKYWQLLYTGLTDRYFGDNNSDLALLESLAHADWVYITFTVGVEVQTLVVWIVKELQPNDRANVLNTVLTDSGTRLAHRFTVTLGIRTGTLVKGERAFILVREGQLGAAPSLDDLYRDPITKIFSLAENSGKLLADISDVWIAVVILDESNQVGGKPELVRNLWLLEASGSGTQRIVQQEASIFISRSALSRSERLLNKSDSARMTAFCEFGNSDRFLVGISAPAQVAAGESFDFTVTRTGALDREVLIFVSIVATGFERTETFSVEFGVGETVKKIAYASSTEYQLGEDVKVVASIPQRIDYVASPREAIVAIVDTQLLKLEFLPTAIKEGEISNLSIARVTGFTGYSISAKVALSVSSGTLSEYDFDGETLIVGREAIATVYAKPSSSYRPLRQLTAELVPDVSYNIQPGAGISILTVEDLPLVYLGV